MKLSCGLPNILTFYYTLKITSCHIYITTIFSIRISKGFPAINLHFVDKITLKGDILLKICIYVNIPINPDSYRRIRLRPVL